MEETIDLKRKRGRPEKDEPPTRLKRSDTRKLLDTYDAAGMVALLEQCYGDVDSYVRCFDSRIGAKQQDILARTIYTLKKEGNEELHQSWDRLIESFHQAKMILARAEALKLVADLRPPQRTGKNAGSAFDKTMAYGKFWLQSLQAPKPIVLKAAKPAKAEPDEDDGNVDDLLEQIEGAT